MIKSYHPRFKVCVRKNICLFIYSSIILQEDRFWNMLRKAWACTLYRFMSIYFFLADCKSVWLDYLIFYHLLNRNILLLLFCVCSINSSKYYTPQEKKRFNAQYQRTLAKCFFFSLQWMIQTDNIYFIYIDRNILRLQQVALL